MTTKKNVAGNDPTRTDADADGVGGTTYGEHAGRLCGTERPGWVMTTEDEEGARLTLDSAASGPMPASEEGNRLVWKPLGDSGGLIVVMTRTPRDEGSAWRMTIENRGRLALCDVTFPLFRSPILDEDTVLLPRVSGRLYPASEDFDYQSQDTQHYPSGMLTMQCAGFYGPSGGVYVGVHDPFASNKQLAVSCRNGSFELRWTWPVPDMGVAGASWEMPGEALIRPFEGDWFDIAKIYRAWASERAGWWPRGAQAGRPDTPDWFKETPVWIMSNGPWPYRDKPIPIAEAVSKIKKFAAYMDDIPCAVHWYNWHEVEYDTHLPHYFPAEEGFAEGIAEVQAAGVRVMPYINAHIWDKDLPDYPTLAEPAAIKSRDGSVPTKTYNGNSFAPMCPATSLWRETVSDLVGKLSCSEYGVDGVYLDQVSAQAAMECFDPNHGHPLGGGCWWTTQGYWPMLDASRDRVPGIILTSESSAEPYVNRLDGYLTWLGYRDGDAAVPLFHAVYSGQVQLFGRLYKWDSWKGTAMYAKTAQALVWGEQLGWIVPDVVDDPVAGPFLKRLSRMRHTLRPYLARGHMGRPPRLATDGTVLTSNWVYVENLHVTIPTVVAGAWHRDDGKAVALILANADEAEHVVSLNFCGEEYGLDGDLEVRQWTATEAPACRSSPSPVASSWHRDITVPPLTAVAIEIGKANTLKGA